MLEPAQRAALQGALGPAANGAAPMGEAEVRGPAWPAACAAWAAAHRLLVNRGRCAG